MSAIVCGKRSFFEDMDTAMSPPTSASGPAYKKFRCSSSTSPVRFTYSPPVQTSPVDQLKALFPDMEIKLLEEALKGSGNDLDLAIKSVNELLLRYSNGKTGPTSAENNTSEIGTTPIGEGAVHSQEPQVPNNLPVGGAEWVDLFVKEMMSATSIDDARARAASILESLEKSINSQASSEAAQSFHKENMMLKEQMEVLQRENVFFRKAFATQLERQKESDEGNQEAQQLKQLVEQYKEKVRTLEVSNYTLSMHLRQAQQSSPIPGRFNPDVF